jgi:hypothetical protein
MANVVIDPRGVGPVGLDRDDLEAAPRDQLLGDPRAHPVELAGAVGGLAEEDDPRIADAIEEAREIRGLDRVDRLGGLADDRGDRARACAREGGARVGGVGLPAFLADQRDETDRAEVLAAEVVRTGLGDPDQLLGARGLADGDHQAAAIGELLEEGLGDVGPPGADQDRVEGGVLGQPAGAVALDHVDVAEVELLHPGGGFFREERVALDRPDLADDRTEDRGGVAGAGADLEDALVAVELEGFEHQGDDVGLGDGLPFLDREGGVVEGELGERLGDESVPGSAAHRLEDQRVGHAAGRDLRFHHPVALFDRFVAHGRDG